MSRITIHHVCWQFAACSNTNDSWATLRQWRTYQKWSNLESTSCSWVTSSVDYGNDRIWRQLHCWKQVRSNSSTNRYQQHIASHLKTFLMCVGNAPVHLRRKSFLVTMFPCFRFCVADPKWGAVCFAPLLNLFCRSVFAVRLNYCFVMGVGFQRTYCWGCQCLYVYWLFWVCL